MADGVAQGNLNYMSDIKYKFLTGVLGKEGSNALKKAIGRDARLNAVVIPRAIIGWLNFISRYEFEGCLPGLNDSYIQFNKNEDNTFSGSIAIGEEIHEFQKSDIYHVASAISVSLGEEPSRIDDDIRDLVLVKLGKSIDILAKAQEIARTLESNLKIKKEETPEESKEVLDKADMPAKTAGANPPKGPVPPVLPGKQKLPLPRQFKPPMLKIDKSQSERKCDFCDGTQFKDNKFIGCICFKSLAKNITTTVYGDGIVLDFPKTFDREAFWVLSDYFRS